MPNYDYTCSACNQSFEIFQSMKDDPIAECPHCKAKAPEFRRLIGKGAGIVFKGSGFYETDYKRPQGTTAANESKPAGSDAHPKSGGCGKGDCCSKD